MYGERMEIRIIDGKHFICMEDLAEEMVDEGGRQAAMGNPDKVGITETVRDWVLRLMEHHDRNNPQEASFADTMNESILIFLESKPDIREFRLHDMHSYHFPMTEHMAVSVYKDTTRLEYYGKASIIETDPRVYKEVRRQTEQPNYDEEATETLQRRLLLQAKAALRELKNATT